MLTDRFIVTLVVGALTAVAMVWIVAHARITVQLETQQPIELHSTDFGMKAVVQLAPIDVRSLPNSKVPLGW